MKNVRFAIVMILVLAVFVADSYADTSSEEVKIYSPEGAINDAIVTINGKTVGALPTTIRLQIGRYLVEVERPGYQRFRKWLDVVAGKPIEVAVQLSAQQEKTLSSLLIASDVLKAEVFIDGRKYGRVPVLASDLSPGVHKIKLVAAGYEDIEQEVALASGKLKKITIRLKATTVLKIVSEPPHVEIWVNNIRKGVAPLELLGLAPGQHIIEGRLEGYQAKTEKVDLEQGKESTVKLDLPQRDAKAKEGAIRVTSNEKEAMVFIDGQFKGKTPLLRHQIVVGPHLVSVRKKGFSDQIATIEVKAGAIAAFDAKLKKRALISTPTSMKAESENADLERELKRMDSLSAYLVAPTHVALYAALGFPYLLNTAITTGFYQGEKYGVDGSILLRTYFSTTEVSGRIRMRFFEIGPWSAAAYGEFGGGGGPKSRNTFHFDFGAIGSFAATPWLNLNAEAAFNIYSDRLCPNIPSDNEVSACQLPPGEISAVDVRERFSGLRVKLATSVVVNINEWISVFSAIDLAIGAERRSFTDDFASIMLKDDPHFYGMFGVIVRR